MSLADTSVIELCLLWIGDEEKPIVSPCEPRFGDYQCVNAMGIFKKLKEKVRVTPLSVGSTAVMGHDCESRTLRTFACCLFFMSSFKMQT